MEADDFDGTTWTESGEEDDLLESNDEINLMNSCGSQHSESEILDSYKRFKFYPVAELENRQQEVTQRVCDILCMPPCLAELLLIAFKWNDDLLEQNYFEDPVKVCKAAGVFMNTNSGPLLEAEDLKSKTRAKFQCPVCWETIQIRNAFGLGCNHVYCLRCLQTYIDEAIRGQGKFLIKCPWPKCFCLFHNNSLKQLIKNQRLYRQYRLSIARSHVESHNKMRWCPNPRCGHVVELIDFGVLPDCIRCTCGFRFCNTCSREFHAPVSCDQVDIWEEKGLDPGAKLTLLWIKTNTKPCPKCRLPIDKNEGCNHMTCFKPAGCGHEWCWLCREDWSTHGSHSGGYFSCNRYEPGSKAHKEDTKLQEEKAELNVYLHYYNRFYNYEMDLKLADDKREMARAKMRLYSIEVANDTSSKRFGRTPDFLLEAVELEICCRQTLKFTYIMSFFMEDLPEKEFFQFQQANLEGITERLGRLNNSPLEELNDDQLRTLNRVTSKYLSAMTDAMTAQAANQVNATSTQAASPIRTTKSEPLRKSLRKKKRAPPKIS